MLPVGCPGDGSVVVAQVFSCKEVRPVGKDDVILRETFFSKGSRRDDENRSGAETKGENGAVTGS